MTDDGNATPKEVSTPPSVERKLAAILSTDVKGYSRLMGDDEEATIRTLTVYREIIASHVRQHRGRVVDSPGDNLLAEFASAVDAVRSAVEIQHALTDNNADLSEHRKMEFRIGINVGDVVVEGERIYGDGVNIAARLEALAEGGGICISGTVYDQVENKLDLGYTDLGQQSVKNIARPVRVYRVELDPEAVSPAAPSVEDVPAEETTLPTLPDKPSIAVLPFVNLSQDPEQEYFSDGMTEDLITDLSKLAGLFVISRNSVFVYKGKAIKSEDVSRELGVRYVLEGSVRKAGNRVRITAQLIDATSDYHLWAERYDRELQDIFELQDEVTQKIVSALAVKLTEGEQQRLSRPRTENVEAYDYYLRGLEYYFRRTQDANLQARAMFEQAVSLDPHFASAHAYLGRTYLMELVNQWTTDRQALEQVFLCAHKAVALDEAQPTAHETLAYAYLGNKQHPEAIAAAEQAIAVDPNAAEAYATLAEVCSFAGQPQRAVEAIETAMRLNPRYPASYLWTLGHAYRWLGKYEEAIALFKRVLLRSPEHLTAHLFLAATYSELEQLTEARVAAAEVLRLNPNFSLKVVAEQTPYNDPVLVEQQVESLRKAGLE
jgi:adenylate cyclase